MADLPTNSTDEPFYESGHSTTRRYADRSGSSDDTKTRHIAIADSFPLTEVLMTIRTVTRALLGTLASVLMVVACRDLVAPDRGTSNVDQSAALINLSGRVVVHPGDMHGWVFYNDQTGAVCAGSACRMVAGPAGQPGGAGSAELADSLPTDGRRSSFRTTRGFASIV